MAAAGSRARRAERNPEAMPTARCVVCGLTDRVGVVVPHASRLWAHRSEECYAGLLAGRRAAEPGDVF